MGHISKSHNSLKPQQNFANFYQWMPTTMWVKKIIPLKIPPGGGAMSYTGSRSISTTPIVTTYHEYLFAECTYLGNIEAFCSCAVFHLPRLQAIALEIIKVWCATLTLIDTNFLVFVQQKLAKNKESKVNLNPGILLIQFNLWHIHAFI